MSTDTRAVPETPAEQPRRSGLFSGPPVKWPVFGASLLGVVAVAIWAIATPDSAYATIYDWTVWVGGAFGWFYIALGTAILVFVLYLGISRFGTMRLGPEHSRPEFSTFAWASMLFAAGIGTDVMFFSVVEPVTQYVAPPVGDGGTVQAARDATVWTLFHYGITGWAMYALMGMALGFFAYRLNLPLAVRSALYPIFGKRIDGVLGHAVDTAAVLGTVFGVATSLGIGVVFLNIGLNELFGVPVGLGAQIGLAVLAITIAAISATTGVDKGIRFLSQLNVLLALSLAGWVLVTGKTQLLLEGVVMNVGDFVASFPGLTMDTMAYDQANEWMNLWTLFFWAWWVAWASFVGLFLARISRGRTIRQFVAGTMVIPFAYIVMWVSIFGNAALDRVRGGDEAFTEAAQNYDGRGFFMLVEQYPASGVVIAVATFVGLLFYVTSADSGALVMANLCSRLRHVQEDGAAWQRIVWAAVTGLLTISVLAVGGIYALQYATVIMGLPFAIVMILVMWGLYKAMRRELQRVESGGGVHHRPAPGPEDRESWRSRIARVTNFVDRDDAERHLDTVVAPALTEVAAELQARGVNATAVQGVAEPSEDDEHGGRYVELRADDTEHPEHPFRYRVQVTMSPVPTYGGRMIGDRDQYAKLDVHLDTGAQDYDVMGYRESQIIHDCLDEYERHLEFLRME
ncbi:choline BCCT transporter BetT [Nocardioides euryhalodurans]|uniref:BCCT family transporter n=1 Tax=Nocardioides euryhalodurans TaxID=2518370 RepID=A0A4P7GPD3_9ACTN|nr:choline BCCT transporter BetT [Nocardioides euryhalodurans]QBR93859.1 BCCT family transporter [Nocardioides euryhalodurans]